jgi:hypothetical protein
VHNARCLCPESKAAIAIFADFENRFSRKILCAILSENQNDKCCDCLHLVSIFDFLIYTLYVKC